MAAPFKVPRQNMWWDVIRVQSGDSWQGGNKMCKQRVSFHILYYFVRVNGTSPAVNHLEILIHTFKSLFCKIMLPAQFNGMCLYQLIWDIWGAYTEN